MNESLAKLEEEFREYLREVRAFSDASIRRHVGTFRRFVRFLGARRVSSAHRVSLELAYAFLEKCARGNGRRHAKSSYQAIRSVLRFLHFTRRHRKDLSRAMTAPCIWRLADVPKAFSEAEVAHMLTQLRADSPYDHRERLVMLLFITYGLRLGEVARMTLEAIDLAHKTITVREHR